MIQPHLVGLGLLATLTVTARAETASLPGNTLQIELHENGSVKAVGAGPHVFTSSNAAAGLFVRDGVGGELTAVGMAAGRDRVTELSQAGLRISARLETKPKCLQVTGVVEDTRKTQDRAVDIVLRLPFSPAIWWGSISETVPPEVTPTAVAKRRQRDDLPEGAGVLERIEHGGLAQDFMPIQCVTTADRKAGVAIAIPPDDPCRFRFAHLREQECLELQFIFGLTPAASQELKGRAPFRFIIYPVDGQWGFRDALRQYYDFYPERFQRRTQASGLWLVSLPSLKDVPDPENYAFWQATRVKEIPMGIQMGMEVYPYAIVGQRELGYLKQEVSSYEDVLAALETKPESTKRSRYSWEVVKPLVESSGLRDSNSRLIHRLRTTDWSGNSISFPMNPSPFLPVSENRPTAASHTYAEVEGELRDYPKLAGVYIDSLGMWGSYENFRRDHFAAARSPLTHDGDGRVFVFNWMPHVDFLRELRQRIGGRLVFANGARPGRAFCAFELDILGMEPNLPDLSSRTQMDCLRSLAGPKPAVCLLDYPDYTDPQGKGLSRSQAEEYIQRFVALGLAPEMRRVPWPRYKERDADLYKRFMPVYRRLDRAGWQPVTHAAVAKDGVWVERFGTKPPELYFSLYNSKAEPAEAKVAIDYQSLSVPASAPLLEIVENRALAGLTRPIALAPHTLRVIQVGR